MRGDWGENEGMPVTKGCSSVPFYWFILALFVNT